MPLLPALALSSALADPGAVCWIMVLFTMNLYAGASPEGDAVSEIKVCRSEEMIVSFQTAVWVWLYVVAVEKADVQAWCQSSVCASLKALSRS